MERYKQEVSVYSEQTKQQCTLCDNQKQETLIVIKGLAIQIKLLQLDGETRDSTVNPDGSLTRLLNLLFENQPDQNNAQFFDQERLFMCALNCDGYTLECLASRFYEKTIKRNYELEVLVNQTKDSSKTTINLALENSRTKVNDSSSDHIQKEEVDVAEKKKVRSKKSSKTPQNELKVQIGNSQPSKMDPTQMIKMPNQDYFMYMSMYGMPYMNGPY